ncbi:threonine/homoserine/homoserine lactone efflux protein [Rhodobium orientis]|uniref:Lysine transporter LysE n=1 Tax=Rhodobium orientis TaxID=34017 RepID=A0A327JG39_9HYPH|nr:LysE family translocator [Rhodobium orientis]MBB4304477.1 threonine/homoserine/homoserine lactone efflux protein [Rhodobium orientis]MBK5948069.1 hypothetical protein [Rhodobium orientis]RAI25367.1 hypothetical protein CH339_18480 [Rhodobium orientis]
MNVFGLAVFVGVYFLAVMTPGPGVVGLIGHTLAHGRRDAVPYVAGMVAGNLIWFACAVGGLALLAQTFHAAFVAIKYASIAYLLYLAVKAWTSEPQPKAAVPPASLHSSLSAAFTALAITLGNPKTMVFYLAILPTVVDLKTLVLVDALACGGAIAVVLPAGMAVYVLAVDRARDLMRSGRGLRLLNRIAGTAMAGAALTIASR